MRTTTDLYDDFEDTVQTCSVQFRDFGGTTRFCGPIRTVRCRNDNQLFRTLLGEPGNGCVLVVDGGGALSNALMGDILAAKGVAASRHSAPTRRKAARPVTARSTSTWNSVVFASRLVTGSIATRTASSFPPKRSGRSCAERLW
jgi:hypothetical protein